MNKYGKYDDEQFVVYNGYKVKIPISYGGEVAIYLGFLLELGSNLNLHLLSFFITRSYQEEFPVIETSHIKLQEFFNETEENIKHALVSLQNLNLISFSKDIDSNIIINLNKRNILKLQENHINYSYAEEDKVINNHYKELIIDEKAYCPHCYEEIDVGDLETMLNYVLKK